MPSTLFLSRARKALVISTVAATGISGFLYLAHQKGSRVQAQGENVGDTFTISKKTSLGWFRPTFEHLGRDSAEALLRKNEVTRTFKPSTTRSVVTRFDNNWVDCNAIGEDRHVEDFLSKHVLSVEKVASLARDSELSQSLNADPSLKLFSVIDGHAGTAMADTLTQKLHPAIVSSLRCSLAGGKPRYTDPLLTMRKCSEGALAFLSDYKHFECLGSTAPPDLTNGTDAQLDRDVISDALSAAFTNLDYEICVKPLRDMLGGSWSGEKVEYNDCPAPAVSGAILERTENPSPWLEELPNLFDATIHTTQPYVIAKPDVAVRSLEKNKDAKGQLKFIVAATDGLWDFLSSEEAVGLVASHLTHPYHEPIPRKIVQSELLEQSPGSSALCPGPRAKEDELDGDWVYQDGNAATHLIRNAFGASQHVGTIYEMLSLKGLPARDFRDDVTCSVIFFDPPAGGDLGFKFLKDRSNEPEGVLTRLIQRWRASPFGLIPSGFA
ncbi:hypothetical protein QFC20_006292 [Naganishia adeliensis]|uniref:Uncharacterized protein n=1 Tax=Naganishia adeliensis TaxID=92952 RepID=A0ACC2VDP2_9TREE|nr:hypothetical protein QFC20_006292 [Naganishia adeliensis]